MKNENISVTLLAAAFIFMLSLLVFEGYGRDNNNTPGYLEIFGKIKSNTDLVHPVMKVYLNDELVEVYTPGSNGRFSIRLFHNHIYTIEISAVGMASKTVMVSTMLPSAELAIYEYEYKFNVMLMPENAHLSGFQRPVAKIGYVADYDGFDYDRQYTPRENSITIADLQEVGF